MKTFGIEGVVTSQELLDHEIARVTVKILGSLDEHSFECSVAQAKRFAVGRAVRLAPKLAPKE